MRTRLILATVASLAMISVAAHAVQESGDVAAATVTDAASAEIVAAENSADAVVTQTEAVTDETLPAEVDTVVAEETVGVEAVAVGTDHAGQQETATEVHTDTTVDAAEEPTL